MKPLLYILIIIGCQNNIIGQSTEKEVRKTQHFESVTINSNIDAVLREDSVFQVIIEASKTDINRIITEVIGNMLYVYMVDKNRWNYKQIKKVYITAPVYRHIVSKNGSDIRSNGNIHCELLNLKSSDGGDIYVKTNSKTVKVEISGGANIELLGSSIILSANISEGGNLDAKKLIVKDASVMVTGGGTALINTTERLKADARGGGDIYYTGSPVKKDIAKYGQNNVRGF